MFPKTSAELIALVDQRAPVVTEQFQKRQIDRGMKVAIFLAPNILSSDGV
jgi:hypothetical protein